MTGERGSLNQTWKHWTLFLLKKSQGKRGLANPILKNLKKSIKLILSVACFVNWEGKGFLGKREGRLVGLSLQKTSGLDVEDKRRIKLSTHSFALKRNTKPTNQNASFGFCVPRVFDTTGDLKFGSDKFLH